MSTEQQLVAGRYQLVRRLGSGAMGVVWEALDERLNRTVAVKQLLIEPSLEQGEADEAVARTMREGRIAARLHHPNAVSVFDVVDSAGAPCLVMEYVPSRSLADVLGERSSLPPEDVATIGAQVASALAAAHAAGIVHRDIKPGNVLLGDNGVVKITDFGISRATDDVTVTKTGLIAGTPAYLAPEVAVGKDPTPAADVFSLGSTLYAAVEGQPPFGLSENTLGLLHAVAAGRIVPPAQAGPLTDVLTSLLQAEPGDRPDAREALLMLRAVAHGDTPDVPAVAAADGTKVLGGTTVAAPPGTRALPPEEPPSGEAEPERPARRSKRGVIIGSIIAALIVLAAILYATGVFGNDGNGNRPEPSHNPGVPPPAATSSETTTSAPTGNDNQPTYHQPTHHQPTHHQPTHTTTTTTTTTSESGGPPTGGNTDSADPPGPTGGDGGGNDPTGDPTQQNGGNGNNGNAQGR